jgi:hypothetical protein
VARRALTVDPWAEEAYRVLAGSALARDERSAARQILARCFAALADIDVDPLRRHPTAHPTRP